MRGQLRVAVVMVSFERCVLDRAIYALDLTVGSGCLILASRWVPALALLRQIFRVDDFAAMRASRWRRSVDSFSPFGLFEPLGLQEGESNHAHEAVPVQSLPRPPFEVVEAEFFLELLMGLFADPARLDGPCEPFDRRVRRQVREIIFAFAGRAMFADDPDFLAGQMLRAHVMDALGRPIGDTHASSGEPRCKATFGPSALADRLPFGHLQHGFRGHRLYIGICRCRGLPRPETWNIMATSRG